MPNIQPDSVFSLSSDAFLCNRGGGDGQPSWRGSVCAEPRAMSWRRASMGR